MLPHNIVTIGDPHLGHKFKVGVPHHRLGQREEEVIGYFETRVKGARACSADLCVMMGDLFDTHTVDNGLVERVYRIYKEDAPKGGVVHILLKGNHDWHRDHSRTSSFDILADLLEPLPWTRVVREPQTVTIPGATYGFFPWMPPDSKMAGEWVTFICKNRDVSAVFGHWDSAWSPHNIIPISELSALRIPVAYSGHEHGRKTVEIGDVTVHWTGSMLPYARAQDPDQVLYKTVDLDKYKELDQNKFHPYCYSVVLTPGQELPYMLDAWEVRVRRETSEEQMSALSEQVHYNEELEITSLWKAALADIPDTVRPEVDRMYKEQMI